MIDPEPYEREIAILKQQHKDLVLRNSILRQRPDLPVDRLACHEQVIALQLENEKLRKEISELRERMEEA